MKKEFIIAILVGLVMGLFITYGIYYSQKTQEENQIATTIQELEQITPSPAQENNGKIAVYLPNDESVVSEKTTTVTGKTAPNDFIVIYVNDTPIITQADDTGNFSKEVALQDLANILKIHVLDEDGEDTVIERTVIVYDEELVIVEEIEEDAEETETEDDSEVEEDE
jgi:uncharacterized protein YgfB (UPF0149 family)